MIFKNIYDQVKKEFRNIIIEDDDLRNKLFSSESEETRVDLKSHHLKPLPSTKGSKPEAITSRYIIKLLNNVGISDDLIVPEVRLKSIQFGGESFNNYPDFGIFNSGQGKSLLFEIEKLNKDLEHVGDGEGIEQAEKWFHDIISLYEDYNAIVTNFNEWFFLRFDESSNSMKAIKKSESEILEIIRDVAIGKERTYLEEETGEAITQEFYNKFSKKLRILLDPNNSEIIISNLDKPADLSDDEFDQLKINYYRTIFFRLLFIKILLDWKLLDIDPIQLIFDKEPKRNYFNSIKNLFFNILNNKEKRIDVIDELIDLPYLNGGLFRLSEIEQENPNISLNSDAILDIWNFLKRYNFTLIESEDENSGNNSINPSILGYIFEKSIGDVRKATGTYYTRSTITDYVSNNTLNTYLVDQINKKFDDKLPWPLKTIREFKMYQKELRTEIYEYTIKLLKNIKICDPAVGSGAFLVSIATLIFDIYNFLILSMDLEQLSYATEEIIENDKRPFRDLVRMKTYIVQNNLYGVDINSSAIDICELRLWLWIVQPPSDLDTINVELEPLPNIEYNIREGNSLFGYTKGIKKIKEFDKVSKEVVQYAPLTEWTGLEKESISQMLLERNQKIRTYYQEKNEEKRIQLRNEIKQLTAEYKQNFDNLLLEEYQEKEILGKKRVIEPDQFEEVDLDNIESILIRTKKGENFDIEDDAIELLREDSKSKRIKGLIFRKNNISITSRVFNPEEDDEFDAQTPQEMFNRILNQTNIDKIKEIKIQYFICLDELQALKPFHWSMEFSDFFVSRGFDILITNPPYGNILNDTEKKILNEEISEDIYLNFLYRFARNQIKLKYAGVLTPKSYLLRQKYLELRNTLLKSVGIYEITDIGSKQFHGATNEVQLLFFNRDNNYTDQMEIRDLNNNELKIKYRLNGESEDLPPVDEVSVCKNRDCSYYDGTASFYYYTFQKNCPICEELTLPLNRIRIKQTSEINKIINKMEKNANLNYLNSIDFPNMIRGEEETGLEKVNELLRNDADGEYVFIDARENFRYYYFEKNASINLEEISSKILKGDNYEYYKKPKLLIKHNNIIPETIYTEKKVCFTSSIYSLLYPDKRLLKYLSAIYNSGLIQFYCIYGINNQKDTTINLNQYMIRHLPIIEPDETKLNDISNKVSNILSELETNEGILSEKDIQELKGIDDIVFTLYGINEDEKELVLSLISTDIDYFSQIYKENRI